MRHTLWLVLFPIVVAGCASTPTATPTNFTASCSKQEDCMHQANVRCDGQIAHMNWQGADASRSSALDQTNDAQTHRLEFRCTR